MSTAHEHGEGKSRGIPFICSFRRSKETLTEARLDRIESMAAAPCGPADSAAAAEASSYCGGGATLLPKGSIRRGNVRNAVAVVIQFSRFRVRILAQSYKNRQEGGGGGAGSVDVCAECISRKPTGRPRLAGWVVYVWGGGRGGGRRKTKHDGSLRLEKKRKKKS